MDYKNKLNKAKEMLRIYDSIHDFWKKRGAQKASEDEEGLSENLLEDIRNDLNEKIFHLRSNIGNLSPAENTGGTSGSPSTPLNEQLKVLSSDNRITNIGNATSTFELNVQHYFESHPIYKKFFLIETKMRISYQEILKQSQYVMPSDLPEGWKQYINNIVSQGILEIYNDSSQGVTPGFNEIIYNDEYKEIINTFVLCYMNGSWDKSFIDEKKSPQAYFTFDAAGKYVKKLFRNDTRMYNLITPQNIADSATTSFNQLQDRIEFNFPLNNETGSFTVTSDAFNKNNESMFEIKFINDNFSEKNRYGFKIGLNSSIIEYIDFNEHEKEGPSVNYLGLLIHTLIKIHDNDELHEEYISSLEVDKKNSVVNILNPLKKMLLNSTESTRNMLLHYLHDSGIFYDLKRMGDHEQCEAAKIFSSKGTAITVLVTLDRLCSLYSRLINQPCIFHNNENLTLYRFPLTIDEGAKTNAEYFFKIKEIIDFYKSVEWIDSLKVELEKIKHLLYTPIENQYKSEKLDEVLINYPVKIIYKKDATTNIVKIINLLLTIKIISLIITIDHYLGLIDTIKDIITPLVSQRENETMLRKLMELKTNYDTFSTSDFSTNLETHKSSIDSTIFEINDLKQNKLVEFERIKQVFNLSFDNNGNIMPLISENEILIMSDDKGVFNVPKKGSNSYLGLYFSAYRSTFESLSKVFRLFDNKRSIQRLTRNKQSLYETIVKTEYFDNIRKITNIEFIGKDNNYIEELNNILFIQKNSSNDEIIEEFNNIYEKLLNMKNKLVSDIIPPEEPRSGMKRGRVNSEDYQISTRKTPRVSNINPYTISQNNNYLLNRIQSGGTTIELSRQYNDLGESLFEIMSRCSEFYYSILSNEANNDTNKLMNLLSTEEKYKDSINELYEDCSVHIQNNLYNIMNYSIENSDAYTYKPDLIFDYITYLFLYDSSGSSQTINTGFTLYNDDVLSRINSSTTPTRKGVGESSGIEVLNPDFIKIREFIEKDTELKNIPFLVKLFITFTFALLYDLSYESLKEKSNLLSILTKKRFNISPYVSNYDDAPSISKLMNRIYLFMKMTKFYYNDPNFIVPREFTSLLTGGKKSIKRYVKKKKSKRTKKRTVKKKKQNNHNITTGKMKLTRKNK